MILNSLYIQNIRPHTKLKVDLSPDVNIITGRNGSGKTSLLEAIYITLQGTSFRGTDKDVLKNNSKWWRIEGDFSDINKRIITFKPDLDIKRKKISIDNQITYRMVNKNKKPIVLFEPDNLRLLDGSPDRRRRFIDRFIDPLDDLYTINLHKYERALKQRNILLKNPNTTIEDLFIWDIALSEYGSYLIEKRIIFIEQINNKLNDFYNSISNNNDLISIHYSSTYINNIKQKLLNNLRKNFYKDKRAGYTTVGPHRHDIIFNLNNSPALKVASRGESRTIILALKLIEIDIIKELTNIQPIVLLDDVFSELDENRQNFLVNNRKSQIIITTTHINRNIIQDEFKEIRL